MTVGRWRSAGVVLITALAGAIGCNTRTPVHESEVVTTAPSGWVNATVPNGPGGDITKVELSPTVTVGSGGGRGTVFIDGPAPEGGLAVSIASASTTLVTVAPPVVVVPAGGFSTDFSFTTVAQAQDVDVTITASTPARTRSARVSVWAAVLSSFYYHVSDPADLIRTAPNLRVINDRTDLGARLTASCIGNVVRASVTPPGSSTGQLSFAAAGQQPLVPGVYDNATPRGTGHHLSIGYLPCESVGRFHVRELDMYANGDVVNMWVTFEAQCAGSPGTVRGEFRVANMRRTVNRYSCTGGK